MFSDLFNLAGQIPEYDYQISFILVTHDCDCICQCNTTGNGFSETDE